MEVMGGFPGSLPWPGEAHEEAAVLLPASTRRAHTGSALTCMLTGGEGMPWPLLLQVWSVDTLVSSGRLL